MMTNPTMTAPTIYIMIVLAILVFAVPRKYLLVPIILAACFVPCEQHVLLFGLHFYLARNLILVAIVRILIKGEIRHVEWNRLDKLVVAWVLTGAAIYILRRLDFQSMIYKSGVLLDVLGIYWVARQSITSWEDIRKVCQVFAICAIAITPLVAIEWTTGMNPFRVLGRAYTLSREGEFRCQASFPHPIIAGAFWAPLVPLFIAMALTDRRKTLYWSSVAASIFIVAATRSSTPVGGLAAVLLLTALYRYRRYGRHMAIGFFGLLTVLHIVMAAPVWHLLVRIRIFSGTTGYHRYFLIQKTIEHFREWALLGTESTAHWGWGLFDVTNQYCLEGIRGGLLTLALFVAILFVAIRTTGAYAQRPVGRDRQWLSWALCCSLVGHCVMFIGVGYFGQIQMLLYLSFALACAVYGHSMEAVLPAWQHARTGAEWRMSRRRLATAR